MSRSSSWPRPVYDEPLDFEFDTKRWDSLQPYTLGLDTNLRGVVSDRIWSGTEMLDGLVYLLRDSCCDDMICFIDLALRGRLRAIYYQGTFEYVDELLLILSERLGCPRRKPR